MPSPPGVGALPAAPAVPACPSRAPRPAQAAAEESAAPRASEEEWQLAEIASLRLEAETLKSRGEGLRAQVRAAECELRVSKSSAAGLSLASTSLGGAATASACSPWHSMQLASPAASPRRQERCRADDRDGLRASASALEERCRALRAERAEVQLDCDALAARARAAEAGAAAARRGLAELEGDLARARGDLGAAPRRAEGERCARMDLWEGLREAQEQLGAHLAARAARRRAVDEAQDEVNGTAQALLALRSERGLLAEARAALLRERAAARGRLEAAGRARAAAAAAAARALAARGAAAARRAAAAELAAARCRGAEAGAEALCGRCGRAAAAAAEVEAASGDCRSGLEMLRADQQAMRLAAEAQEANLAELQAQSTGAANATRDLRASLAAAMDRLLQTREARLRPLRELQEEAEGTARERAALTATAERLVALGREVHLHAELLARELQDARGRGAELRGELAAALAAAPRRRRAAPGAEGRRRGRENADPAPNAPAAGAPKRGR